MLIRPIKKNEILLLTEFLYEAIFQKDRNHLVPRTIIQEPALWIYIDGFGTQKDDFGLVAELDGKIVGAVWVRCIQAYGHIENGVPEFAIAVYPEYRKRGIGTTLMKEMLKLLKDKGYAKTSLAVQKENHAAVKMYRQLGFEVMDENNQEYIMICNLNKMEKCEC